MNRLNWHIDNSWDGSVKAEHEDWSFEIKQQKARPSVFTLRTEQVVQTDSSLDVYINNVNTGHLQDAMSIAEAMASGVKIQLPK